VNKPQAPIRRGAGHELPLTVPAHEVSHVKEYDHAFEIRFRGNRNCRRRGPGNRADRHRTLI
jgi:hypothetical protein